MTALWIALALLAVAGGWFVWRVMAALKDLQFSVERANEAENGAIKHHSRAAWGPFRAIYRELDQVCATLAALRRQISDENLNLRAILSSMAEGVLIVDSFQRIRMANDSLHSLFNLTRSPINRSIMEVFRNHDLQEAIQAALQTREAHTREITTEALQDGVYIAKHFEVTAVALSPGEKQAAGAIAVFHDITRIKQLESLRREFVANVSHELRTPLSIINGYLETLLDGALDDRESAERFLRVMARHGERLNLLIEDLLTLSKLESATPGMRLEPLDLRSCIERVIEQLDRNLEEKGAKVQLSIPSDAAWVEADELRLEQALFNLLDNAIKYGAKEEPRISVSTGKKGSFICISIQDNGPGIPLGDQPHIFERFYRVHKDRARDAGGTGLGLSIVKHIAQAHGGTVTVSSSSGNGSTFQLMLPTGDETTE